MATTKPSRLKWLNLQRQSLAAAKNSCDLSMPQPVETHPAFCQAVNLDTPPAFSNCNFENIPRGFAGLSGSASPQHSRTQLGLCATNRY